MEEVKINWRRSKIVLHIIFAVLILFSALNGYVSNSLSIFLASIAAYGVLFFYLYGRVAFAEANIPSIPKNQTPAQRLQFFKLLSGGAKKFMLAVLGSTFAAIFTLVVVNAF